MKRPSRERDGQQWLLDYLIKTTGRAVHFEEDSRVLPAQAKNLRMVSKHQERSAQNAERLARAAEAHGDRLTARALYRVASERFREAQHFTIPIMGERRRALHARMLDCAARLHALADYPIERVDIPFEGKSLAGLLHLLPEAGHAPAVVYLPGMDTTKENYPNPLANEFAGRGMHVLALDWPGNGESWLRGIHITPEGPSAAARAAFEYLAARPEVDEARIGVYGRSFGSLWALQAAAVEPRFAACAGAVACFYWDRLTIFDECPIRFEQVFMTMANMEDEEAFRRTAEGYTMKGYADRVKCPALMAAGEFDPLNALDDAETVFEALAGPKEMWVFEDEFHQMASLEALGGLSAYPFIADWMRRALDGDIPPGHERKTFVRKSGEGMYPSSG